MDESVACHDVIVLNLNTFPENGTDIVRALFSYTVGKSTVGDPSVQAALSADTGHFHQCERQHRLVVFEERCFCHFIETIHQLVIGDKVFQDVVAHIHVQRIGRTCIVVTCTYLESLIAIIVIPSGALVGTSCIGIVGKFNQFVN